MKDKTALHGPCLRVFILRTALDRLPDPLFNGFGDIEKLISPFQ